MRPSTCLRGMAPPVLTAEVVARTARTLVSNHRDLLLRLDRRCLLELLGCTNATQSIAGGEHVVHAVERSRHGEADISTIGNRSPRRCGWR